MKDKVLEYCNKFVDIDISHIQDSIENKKLIEEGNYRHLNGCPSSFGLDDYIGLCEDSIYSNMNQFDMCELCWKKALGVTD